MHDAPPELDREGQKQGVKRRTIESLTEEAGSRRQHQPDTRTERTLKTSHDCRAGILPHLTVQDERIDSSVFELPDDCLEMLRPASKDEAVPAAPRGSGDVLTNCCSALLVLHQPTKRRLDVLSFFGPMVGFVDDQIEGVPCRC